MVHLYFRAFVFEKKAFDAKNSICDLAINIVVIKITIIHLFSRIYAYQSPFLHITDYVTGVTLVF